ncbi:MAG TPA: EAL domain-containing protein [Natronosporangium sp.]
MKDNEARRTLRLFVGSVVLSGLACLAWAALSFDARESLLLPLIVAGLVVVASTCRVQVNVRAQFIVTPAGAAILVAVAMLPTPWATICVAVGAVVARVLLRQQPHKAAFNASKDTAAATVAGAIFQAVGVPPVASAEAASVPWWTYLLALGAAAVAQAMLDMLAITTVVSLASRTSWRRALAREIDAGAAVRLADLAVAAATIVLYLVNPLLLAATPLAVVVTFLSQRHRTYLREERRAWQSLAASTDALSTSGLDGVIHTAIKGAADLFPDLEIEVELRLGGNLRVVRGGQFGVLYDGDAASAPVATGPTIDIPLGANPGGDEPLGMLRLRFRVEARLTDREQHMLTTFAAGLSTAIRNAAAYAEVSRLADKNAYDATHDALTDLPNRRYLYERTTELLAGPDREQLAMMLLDLDYFKEVNDTLGHDAGDRVLVEVADRLRTAAGNALVARLGGDEFAILFSAIPSSAAAVRRARDVLKSLHRPMDLDGVLISLHTSAGLAIAGDSTDTGELLRRADVAMYQAKDSGRQVALYARARDSADLTRLELAGALPRAVEDNEFTVVFQPIVDLASGKVIAAEALTRWAHPDLGDLPPSTFLGLIERSGLLTPFTEVVLDRALTAAASWRRAGFDLQIAVNVSPRSLADPALPRTVRRALEQYGVPGERLTLELTETAAIGHLDVVTRGAAALRDLDVQIALDDFGTRHSSLSAVFQVPVNELKIDRTFVAELDSSPEAMAVVRSIIELGRSLDHEVVAEGIEEASQRQALWELGCTSGQGSLFGWPPQSSEDLLATLQRGYNDVPGTLAAELHPEAQVVRLPRQGSRVDTEAVDEVDLQAKRR